MADLIPLVEATPAVNQGDPASKVRVLADLLGKLGIGGALATSQRLLQQAQDWNIATGERKQWATRRWVEHRERALRGEFEPADVPRLTAEVWQEVAPWLDADETRAAPGMAAMWDLQRDSRGRSGAALEGEASGYYSQLQAIAKRAVERMASLRALPARVWSSGEQAPTAAIQLGYAWEWTQLVELATTFDDCHKAAAILRGSGGLPVQVFPNGCNTEVGMLYLNWEKASEGIPEVTRLVGPLRVRYAVDHAWEPGLWTPADHAARQQPPKPSPWQRARGWLLPSPLDSDGKPVEVA